MNLNKYDPRLKKYDELLETFISGEKILKDLHNDLMPSEKGNLTNQSWIITGQRGSGKSHLVALLYQEILRNELLNNLWMPILFPEELFMVDSLYRLLIEVLNRYLNLIPDEEKYKSLRNTFLELKKKKLPETLPGKAEAKQRITREFFDILSKLKHLSGKKIILFLENIQFLFKEQLSEKDLKHLRSFFHENQDVFIIIGTSTAVFDQVENPAKPFYHFFRIRHIDSLNRDETIQFLNKLSSFRNEPEIHKKINNNLNHIHTYNILTGGNSRLLLFLYELLSDNEELNTELIIEKISELTPYFLDKIKELSKQRRILLDACVSCAPVFTPKEISEITNENLKTTIANIKTLETEGWIKEIWLEGENIKKSETFYAIKDYFYRIWYRLRMGNIFESEIYCMAELASLLFSRNELETQIIKYAGSNNDKKSIFENALKLITDEKYFRNINILKEHFHNSLENNINLILPDIKTDVSYEMKNKSKDEILYNLKSAVDYLEKRDYKNALIYYDEILKIDTQYSLALRSKGIILYFLEKYDDAIEYLLKSLKIEPNSFQTLYFLGQLYFKKEDYKNSILFWEKVIEINTDDIEILYFIGESYYRLSNYRKSIAILSKYIEKNGKNDSAYSSICISYFFLEEYEKSYFFFSESLKINKNISNYIYFGINYLSAIALKIFSASTEVYILLNNAASTESKIEALCRLILLDKFPVLTDTFDSILNSNEISEENTRKLIFLLRAYSYDIFAKPENALEIKIFFNSWLKIIDKIYKNDLTKYKNHLFAFIIDFILRYKDENAALDMLYNLFLDARKEYTEISEMIPQILNYFINPQGRETQKLMADPLFSEIIKKLSGK
jgi:tetratricopeptide (TPR) repeat protein